MHFTGLFTDFGLNLPKSGLSAQILSISLVYFPFSLFLQIGAQIRPPINPPKTPKEQKPNKEE
jgi:hypothetical protein